MADVRIVGNRTVNEDTIYSYLRTRRDREFDPEQAQSDKRRLAGSGLFREIRLYVQQSPAGVVVTFEVFERPTVRYVQFHGNYGISDGALLKQAGIKTGDALNLFTVEDARRKVEEYYHTKGYPDAQVEIVEGDNPAHEGVILGVSEGALQRLWNVDFVGNTIASDGRLQSLIQSKPGWVPYLSWLRGKVDESKVNADLQKLTDYYRGLGFFRARIGCEKQFGESGEYLTLRFVIDEGPRYVVNTVTINGTRKYSADQLAQELQLAAGEYFNLDQMNRDINTLRDKYGEIGHVYAEVEAVPQFALTPGQLDLVYQIDEGGQFRIGRINVHIAGDTPHTRESVVLDRISIRPGDLADMREIRNSERRLKASELFENDPSQGKAPSIRIRTPELADVESIAQGGGPTFRGQSPSPGPGRGAGDLETVDLEIEVPPLRPAPPTSSPPTSSPPTFGPPTFGPPPAPPARIPSLPAATRSSR